jgi:hypothetical protein
MILSLAPKKYLLNDDGNDDDDDDFSSLSFIYKMKIGEKKKSSH